MNPHNEGADNRSHGGCERAEPFRTQKGFEKRANDTKEEAEWHGEREKSNSNWTESKRWRSAPGYLREDEALGAGLRGPCRRTVGQLQCAAWSIPGLSFPRQEGPGVSTPQPTVSMWKPTPRFPAAPQNPGSILSCVGPPPCSCSAAAGGKEGGKIERERPWGEWIDRWKIPAQHWISTQQWKLGGRFFFSSDPFITLFYISTKQSL